MKRLFPFMKGYGKECVLGPLFKLIEATFELFVPLVVASIIDGGIIQGKGTSHIIYMCLILIALGAVGLICAVTAQFFAAKAAVGFCTKLRHAVMQKLLGLSYKQIDSVGTSTMVTRMTADINQIQNGINLTLRLLLRSPFVVFGAMIMAFTIDFKSALVFVAVIPLLCFVVFGIMLITMPMYKKVQGGLDKVTSATRENLSGTRVLRAFCKEEEQSKAFSLKTELLCRLQIVAGRISAVMNPATFLIVNVAIIVLIYIGAIKVEGGILTQGLVIALYNYMSQILVELVKMANLIITITKAGACGGRVADLLELSSEETQGEKSEIKGEVEFKNVSLKYFEGAEPAIENISFKAEVGDTIGVIGGTGSGKTSLINLIMRLYEASEGEVLIDGKDSKKFDLVSLRNQIGIVPQKSVLFKGTLRSNLLWGNENASDEDLLEALERAQALDFVKEKQGLETKVEQGGVNFSGGQRQRLCIARALVRKPKILILDDSASALDYATDAKLRIAIKEYSPTTFIVSQRASSVRFADKILVLDDGVLVGCGKHEELIESCEVYSEIYYSQFEREVAR